ncbi:MAG: PHP domain-containing protein [Turicibacter sp.]|nr:PHP domain-containing protein [Turicibacter sp.]
MRIDLHVHTDQSDGADSLESVLKAAHLKQVTHLGIVNHDTLEGLDEAMALGEKSGIAIIPGIEISAMDFKTQRKVHILGYYVDPKGENIRNLCGPLLKARHQNSLWQIGRLQEAGYPLDTQRIMAQAKGGTIYKQHIMNELVGLGYTNSIYSGLYQQFFKNGGICHRDIEYVDALEAVRAIKADGGIAVLAHPGQLESYASIGQLVDAGLDGIELNHEDHTEEDHELVRKYAEKYGLFVTGGTDYHGMFGTKILVGDILCPPESAWLFTARDAQQFRAFQAVAGYRGFMGKIIKEAGERLRAARGEDMGLAFKEGNHADLVTRHDMETERFLVEQISAKHPAHGFITEEGQVENRFSEFTWIIDPIDGTTNFATIGKDFAISIALFKGKKPYLGMVYDVMEDTLYEGIACAGAFKNGEALSRLSQKEALKEVLVDVSLNALYNFEVKNRVRAYHLVKKIRGHRAYGSAAISLCKVATGELGAYISSGLGPWDYAAAIILLNEVGGSHTVSEINLGKVPMMGAANSRIFQELQGMLGFEGGERYA